MNDPHERILRRAHEIWEREGRPHGKHDEHWSRAEREVQAESGTAAEASSGTTAKRRGSAKSTRAAAQTLSAVATGTGDKAAAPAKEPPKAKTETAKAPRAGRKKPQTDNRKGAAPH